MRRGEVIDMVRAERRRQDTLFGNQANTTVGKWNCILVEEVGEVAKAILDLQEATEKGSARQRYHAREHLKTELVQVAAVAVAWLEAM